MNRRYDPPPLALGAGGTPEYRTSAAIIVENGAVLLERRPDRPGIPAAGYWDIPGGHLREGESPERALVREMHEELGITVTRFRLGAVQDERDASTGRFYRHFVFIADVWSGTPEAREAQTLQWVALETVPTLDRLNPLVAAALEDCLRHGWI